MAHIGLHHIQTILIDDLEKLLAAGGVGGDLGFQVGHVLRDVAAGVLAEAEHPFRRGLVKIAPIHQLHVVDQHALFVDMAAVGWRRAGGAAADVGVVAAVSQPEGDLVAHENRRNHGHIRQMRAAVEGRVEHVRITRPGIGVETHDSPHAVGHGTQMHGHMGRVGHQVAIRVENRAGKVQPLLYVHRPRGVFQRHAHLIGDGHEEVVEDLEQHRIDLGAGGMGAGFGRGAFENQVAHAVQMRRPAGFKHIGAGALGDDRGAGDARGGVQRVAVKERDVLCFVAEMHRDMRPGCGAARRECGGRGLAGGADGLDRQHLEQDRAVRRVEAEALLVDGLEGGLHRIFVAEGHLERLVRAVIAQMSAA